MPILQYETRIAGDGSITLPLLPEYRNRKIVVVVEEEVRRDGPNSNGERLEKTPEQDFLDFCEKLAMPALSDDDVDRIKYERLMEKNR